VTATVWTVRTDAPSDAPRPQLMAHLVRDTPSLTQDDYVRLTTASLGVLGSWLSAVSWAGSADVSAPALREARRPFPVRYRRKYSIQFASARISRASLCTGIRLPGNPIGSCCTESALGGSCLRRALRHHFALAHDPLASCCRQYDLHRCDSGPPSWRGFLFSARALE